MVSGDMAAFSIASCRLDFVEHRSTALARVLEIWTGCASGRSRLSLHGGVGRVKRPAAAPIWEGGGRREDHKRMGGKYAYF